MVSLELSPADLLLFARLLGGELLDETEQERCLTILDEYERNLRR